MKATEGISNDDLIWGVDAEAAHEEALKRVRAAFSAPATHHLDLSDLQALTKLPEAIGQCDQLQSLDCSNTKVSDLAPLSGLNQLQSLDCSETQVSDLAPLSGLNQLQSFACSYTQVSDLAFLSGLNQLRSLDCSDTQVSELVSLSGLNQLQSLDCSGTPLSDLAPLSGLSQLQFLNCSDTQVSDLAPLSGLSQLHFLNCSDTQVSDLAPLSGLSRLQRLNCSGTQINDMRSLRELLSNENFQTLNAYRTRVRGLPDEVLSTNSIRSCADSLRAHFADLGDNPQRLDSVKLIILGNGRIGKTQICNRLRDLPFEADADSTHGIQLSKAPIPGDSGTFRIWDFGGQDIYHGTHALFLRSRAVFLLVWTPDTDNSAEDIPSHGLRFRNRPVGWWLDFVRRFGEPDTPLVVVQNQIDREGEYDRGDHPNLVPLRKHFSYCTVLAMSAATGQKLPSLKDALQGAAARFNPPLIGAGRLAVVQTLRDMLAADQGRASNERKHRTLSLDAFRDLCETTGGISDPEQFLCFLHNAGEVFWLHSEKQSIVILDQAWALEAIYAIYERQKCWTNLLDSRGRFSRSVMGSFIWDQQGYSEEEQKLFVSFMRQSRICFQVSGGRNDDMAIYIAPDALPDHLGGEHPAPIEAPDAEHSYFFEQVAPGLMRTLLVEIGQQAKVNGTYWRHGFSGYSSIHQARVLIEQSHDPDRGCGLHLSAKGRGAPKLIRVLEQLCEELMNLFQVTPNAPTPNRPEGDSKVSYGADPNAPANFFVSYAWGDTDNPARAQIVDEFCAQAKEKGIYIRRDKDEIDFGQSISEFMEKLVDGDRVLVVLTEKYLHSVACMTELYQIWHHAGHNLERFMSKVRLFTAPDADVFDPVGRALIGKYWHDEYERQKPVLDFMGDQDRVAHNQLKRFHAHVPDILKMISDRLQPRSLEDLITYALD
ncbi:leucine-rich repeat domain-containing protein [Sagittula sp. NFXS13]